MASQPFGISGRDGGCVRRHVPDYLLVGPGNVTVIDVKPFEQLRRPEEDGRTVQEALEDYNAGHTQVLALASWGDTTSVARYSE